MKNSIRWIILIVFLAIVGGFIWKTATLLSEKKEQKEVVEYMPTFSLLDLDSIAFTQEDLPQQIPTVVIHFNTECSYCQYEAEELKKHKEAFQNINVIMISEEPIEKIKSFQQEYQLEEAEFIYWGKTKEDGFYETFGDGGVPSIYIYSSSNQLLKHYIGETKIEAILEATQKGL